VDGAIESYDRVLALDPNSASALYNKEFALYRVGKHKTAVSLHEKLESIDPGFVESLDDRGTKFYLPSNYSSKLNYTLPERWY